MSRFLEEVEAPAEGRVRPRVVSAGSQAWVDRAVSLAVLCAAIAAILLAWEQLDHINTIWLGIVGGGIFATAVLLPLYAWSSRGIRVPATILAINVMVGLGTWPIAWQGVPTQEPPFLWMLIGVATLVLSTTWGNAIAVPYNVIASTAYLVVRLTPSGGGVAPLVAVQDALMVAIQPLILVAVFTYIRSQSEEADSWTAVSQRLEGDTTLRTALEGERARLDATIHDEVMTTLVSAGRSSGSSEHLVSQARHAVASLDAQAGDDTGVEDFVPGNVSRLVRDVVAAACPTARYTEEVDVLVPRLPHGVISALVRAVREATINAERHAQASHIRVHLLIAEDEEGEVEVTATVSDDGRGFDPAAVDPRRLGIRVSVRSRMESVGGQVSILSEPGRGTMVRLSWTGYLGDLDEEDDLSPEATRDHVLFERLDVRPVGWVGRGAMAVFMLVGCLELVSSSNVLLTLVALGISAALTVLVFLRFGDYMSSWRAWFCAAFGIFQSLAGGAAMLGGNWNAHLAWWLGPVILTAAAISIGGHRIISWVLAGVAVITVMASVILDGQSMLAHTYLVINPLAWMVVVELLLAWIGRVQFDMDIAQRAAEEASVEGAASFGRLVLREVWLADLRAQVDPLLNKIADPSAVLTAEDRRACLALEGTLRDGIRAANLASPSLSGAIMAARLRGVDVTLVDNRGGQLPAAVRTATLKHLESVVRTATEGRIVARTAPQGYQEAVTIVVEDSLGSRMARIDNEGMILVR
ncbi:MAG: sensor histidine kinase [Propioniciclava sp.]